MAETSLFVLDSWPVLEWIQKREPAFSAFDRLLEGALRGDVRLLMSRINYGEVLYSCWRKFPADKAAQVLADVETFPIEYVDADAALVEQAARIKITVSASYADCFAAALAIRESAPLLTGDAEFRKPAMDQRLTLHWLGA